MVISKYGRIGFAEVQLFDQGSQISRDSLTFTLSSTNALASYCDDGDLTTDCVTSTSDADRGSLVTLTIRSSWPIAVSQVVLYSRQNYWYESGGAALKASLDGVLVWSAVVPSAAPLYSFTLPSPPTQPTSGAVGN